MLVPNDIYDRIDDIIERAYTDFTYRILGRDFLTDEQRIQAEALGMLVGSRPLLELVYLLVKRRSEQRYQTDDTLQKLLSEIFATGILGTLPDTAQATIDNAKAAFDQILERAKADIKAKVSYELVQANKNEQTKARQFGVIPPIVKLDEDEASLATIMAGVGAALLVAHQNFKRDFSGELTTLVNQAAVDAAFEKYGTDALEVYCMKKIVLDNRTSEHCKRWYLNPDGTPTVYKLKELVANGSNDGRPKSQWLPVVMKDHPRCFTDGRTLVLTSDGWKQIQSIKIGEQVLTHTGKFKKVIDTICEDYFEEPVVILKYNYLGSMQRLTVTPDHKFLMNGKWVEAKDLKVGNPLASLLFPCPVCGNPISPKVPTGFKLNTTCSLACKDKWITLVTADYHKNLSFELDNKRDEVLKSLGWTVLRFGLGGVGKPTHSKANILKAVDRVLNNHDEKYSFATSEVVSIKVGETNWGTKIYCLTVEDDESFIARGLVSHNCRSQLIILGRNPEVPSSLL